MSDRAIGSRPMLQALADQGCAKADVEVLHLGVALAQVGEAPGEAGARHHLQQDVGHARLGHPRLDGPCGGRTRLSGSSRRVERGDDDLGFAVHGLEAQVGIVAGASCDLAVCIVEALRQGFDLDGAVERPAERARDHQPRLLPGLALEHALAWIPVPDAGPGEHVAALDGETPGVDHGEDVSAGIVDFSVAVEDVPAPRLGNDLGRRAPQLGARPVRGGLEMGDGGP